MTDSLLPSKGKGRRENEELVGASSKPKPR